VICIPITDNLYNNLIEFYLQMSKVEVNLWFDVNWKLYKSYTLCLKKVYPVMFDNNFGKCEPILKILLYQLIHIKILTYTPQDFHYNCNLKSQKCC